MNELGRSPQGDATYKNIKALGLLVSVKKYFENGLLCSYVPTCDPRGGDSFDPRGIIRTNLVEVCKEMLPGLFRQFVEFFYRTRYNRSRMK